MLELREFPKEAHYATAHRGAAKVGTRPRSGPISRAFQVLATVYAIVMLVITVGVYTRSEQHPGPVLFFVACLASFYIICYNALSIEMTFKSWLDRHYPALRELSIPVAVVLATVPIGILYVMQTGHAVKAGASGSTKVVAAVAPATVTATKPADSPVAQAPARISVVKDIRYLSGPGSTTVAIELDETVQYEINRLTGPDRIYLDFRGTKLDPALAGKKLQIQDSLLRAIRVAEHDGNLTRVTLETRGFSDYSVTPAPNSHGLLIELRTGPGQS